MDSCKGSEEQSEKNRKNALILKSHIFKHDLVKIIHYCFCMFKPMQHNKQFLIDAATFNHEFLACLEDYSRGRVFSIATGQKRMFKKKKVLPKKKGLTDELSEPDQDFNPERPDELEQEDDFYDEEMNEESDEEREVQRQFEFVPEIAILVDYTVVRTYITLFKNPAHKENPDVYLIVAQFFKRMVTQLKQVWIFFQLDFLVAF